MQLFCTDFKCSQLFRAFVKIPGPAYELPTFQKKRFISGANLRLQSSQTCESTSGEFQTGLAATTVECEDKYEKLSTLYSQRPDSCYTSLYTSPTGSIVTRLRPLANTVRMRQSSA